MALSGGMDGFVSFKQSSMGLLWVCGGAALAYQVAWRGLFGWVDWLWAGPLFRLPGYPGMGGRAIRPHHPSGIVTVTYLTLLLSHRAQRYSH